MFIRHFLCGLFYANLLDAHSASFAISCCWSALRGVSLSHSFHLRMEQLFHSALCGGRQTSSCSPGRDGAVEMPFNVGWRPFTNIS